MINTFKPVIFSDTSIIDQEILPIINSEGKEDFGMCLTVTTGYACVEVILDYPELKNAIRCIEESISD